MDQDGARDQLVETLAFETFFKEVNHEHSFMGSSNPSRPAYRHGRGVEVFQFRANRAFLESDSPRSLAGDERL